MYAELKPKTTIRVGADAWIENVRFDDLHRGGIVLPDMAIMETGKSASFGEGCLSRDLKELAQQYKGRIYRGRHAGPDRLPWPGHH